MTKPLRFAVIGHPIGHSRSPQIHKAFANQFGCDLQYERIDADPQQFEAVVRTFFSEGGIGLNVTVPFKERAWKMARGHLSARAADAQAVNTLWQARDALHGCNTDGLGLVRDLTRLGMTIKNRRILLLGAGGAARGVIGPLLHEGCSSINVANRTEQRAKDLVTQWCEIHPQDATRLSAGPLPTGATDQPWDVIINATASSLQGQSLDLPQALFTPQTAVYDMMYGVSDTPLLLQAKQAGAVMTADGLGMLVGQAAESFLIWHKKMPDVEPVIQLMRKQLTDAVR